MPPVIVILPRDKLRMPDQVLVEMTDVNYYCVAIILKKIKKINYQKQLRRLQVSVARGP